LPAAATAKVPGVIAATPDAPGEVPESAATKIAGETDTTPW
jgi:hypothetical protein